MEYEKDYMIRLAKEMARLMAYLITGKKDEEAFEDKKLYTSLDGLYGPLIKLADHGNINEAENLLFNQLDRSDIEQIHIGLAFYEHINGYTDAFLKQSFYTREEIIQGMHDLAKIYGISEQVLALLMSIN